MDRRPAFRTPFALVATAALLIAGCATATGSPELPTSACDTAARVATSDPVRSERRLDPLLVRCSSIADLQAAGARYGVALIGPDVLRFAILRCREPGAPHTDSLCPALLAASSDGPSPS